MLVAIAGAGNLGHYLLEFFSDQKIDLILIEKDESKIKRIQSQYDIMLIKGDMLSHYILRSANVAACDLFIACSLGDSNNIVSCQLAKRLGAKHTVARVYSETIFPYEKNDLEEYFGLDWLVSPSLLTGYRLANFLFDDQSFAYDNYFGARVNVSRIRVKSDSPCLGKTPSKALKPFDNNLRLVTITRNNEVLSKEKLLNVTFQENDYIVLIGKGDIAGELLENFHHNDFNNKKIYIAGISSTTLAMLTLWDEKKLKNQVTIFEDDLEVCQEIMEKFSCKVINLDPADSGDIVEFDPDLDGVFICSSINDADNLTFALNAQQTGFKHIITMVNEYDKMRLFKHFSAFKTISPPELSAREIHRYFNQEISTDFELIKGSRVHSVIKTIEKDSDWISRSISEVADEINPLEILCVWDQGKIELCHSSNSDFILNEGAKVLIISSDPNDEKENRHLNKVLNN